MSDIVDPETRSRMMSGIRGKDTKPELLVRKFLHRAGLRFRLHASLPGRPDLVLPKYNVAIFVHGCFWHRHRGCRFATDPKTNSIFWQDKFEANVARDRKATRQLRALGWRVIVVWSCKLEEAHLQKLVDDIKEVN